MPSVTLQPDAADGKDTQVSADGGGTPARTLRNYGTYQFCGATTTMPGLIEFGLSSIAATATCATATLYLYQGQQGTANAVTVTIYSIAVDNAAWIEGTGNGAAIAAAGEPCWNALAADGVGGVTTAWAGSAGLSTSGTDYEAVAIGSFNGNRSDANGTEYAAALTAVRVRGWFGASNTNYGMKLSFSSNIGNICSSDHATASYRPKLVVEYELPGSGGIFASSIFHSAIFGQNLTR